MMHGHVGDSGTEGNLDASAGTNRREPGLIARAETLASVIDQRVGAETNPFTVVVDRQRGPVDAVICGRDTIMFGTNNYLGLNHEAACLAAANEALEKYGTGATASRVAGGNTAEHQALEREMAEFYGLDQAIVFSTGFLANLGTIGTIARQGDAIFIDAHSHASIIDAATLSGARVRKFRHNDASHLERLFATSDVSSSRVLVVVEGAYSVWGDRGNLRELLTVAKERGATTLVDEAHGLGLFGARGRGVVEEAGVEQLVDVITGTMSKSVGVIGGFCATSHAAFRNLRFMARAYLFTASLPPAIVASAREALRIIATKPDLRRRLWQNAEYFYSGLRGIGLELCAPSAPIGSIRMPNIPIGRSFWSGLLDRGILTNLMIPPATPNGEVLIRFSVSAAHSRDHLDRALAVFAECFRNMKTA
jgi:8-amino-7-oxononanoate synthase